MIRRLCFGVVMYNFSGGEAVSRRFPIGKKQAWAVEWEIFSNRFLVQSRTVFWQSCGVLEPRKMGREAVRVKSAFLIRRVLSADLRSRSRAAGLRKQNIRKNNSLTD